MNFDGRGVYAIVTAAAVIMSNVLAIIAVMVVTALVYLISMIFITNHGRHQGDLELLT